LAEKCRREAVGVEILIDHHRHDTNFPLDRSDFFELLPKLSTKISSAMQSK
jgi:hypothetical protein